jgi:hypothetical protein
MHLDTTEFLGGDLLALTNDRRCRDGAISRDLLDIAPSSMRLQQWLFLAALHLAQSALASALFIGDACHLDLATGLLSFVFVLFLGPRARLWFCDFP